MVLLGLDIDNGYRVCYKYNMRKDYKLERNKKWFEANNDPENPLSINEIAMNPSLNPERVTPQRIHQVIKEYPKHAGIH